jgi:ABC-2 type transport system permease protein
LRFHDSVLGYLWPLLSPLLIFGVLYVAFTEILRFGDDIENYAVILLFNIMLFTFFSDGSTRAVNSLVIREAVLRKAEFPRAVVPLSMVLTAVLTLGFSLVVVVGFMLASGVPVYWTWLLVPLPIIGIVVFTVGCSLLLSALYVRLRDVGQIWGVVTRAGFYASPILFPVELYPTAWKWLLFINPLAPLLAQARVWMVDPDAPSYAETMGGSEYLLGPLLIGVAICVLGVWYFNRQAPVVAEEL